MVVCAEWFIIMSCVTKNYPCPEVSCPCEWLFKNECMCAYDYVIQYHFIGILEFISVFRIYLLYKLREDGIFWCQNVTKFFTVWKICPLLYGQSYSYDIAVWFHVYTCWILASHVKYTAMVSTIFSWLNFFWKKKLLILTGHFIKLPILVTIALN